MNTPQLKNLMATAIRELQVAFLPAGLGAVAVIYSNILGWSVMGAVRYSEKGKEVHPYKPWNDKSDQADAHFRSFKATQNGMEWTVLVTPVLFLYHLYASAIPVVGAYLYWSTAVLGVAFGYFNVQYIKGVIRLAPRSATCAPHVHAVGPHSSTHNLVHAPSACVHSQATPSPPKTGCRHSRSAQTYSGSCSTASSLERRAALSSSTA